MRTPLMLVVCLAYGIDLDGSFRSDRSYVAKYREMAMHPEIEKAIEDICNEAIVFDEKYPVDNS